MNREELVLAFDRIDDRYLEESMVETKKKMSPYRIVAAVIAAVAMISFIAYFLKQNDGIGPFGVDLTALEETSDYSEKTALETTTGMVSEDGLNLYENSDGNYYNVDRELLINVTTAEVLKMALEYSLAAEILETNGYEKGYEILVEVSSVYQELIQRKNVKEVVMEEYASVVSSCETDDDAIKKTILEVIIAYQLWGDMSGEEKSKVIEFHNSATDDKVDAIDMITNEDR